MGEYTATIYWQRQGAVFTDQKYSRAHQWRFDGGLTVPGSSSPHVVRLPFSDPAAVDPEEAFVASLSSCHMLFFLSIAAQRGFVVDDYRDHAVGYMEKNDEGNIAMTKIALRPQITFSLTPPGAAELAAMHHAAHAKCYIANSIKADVVVEEAR